MIKWKWITPMRLRLIFPRAICLHFRMVKLERAPSPTSFHPQTFMSFFLFSCPSFFSLPSHLSSLSLSFPSSVPPSPNFREEGQTRYPTPHHLKILYFQRLLSCITPPLHIPWGSGSWKLTRKCSVNNKLSVL